MSGNFALDWAALAVSLFNTILLLWLGLTVLLNAERRSWGMLLAGGGLLGGGLFFICHTALLGYGTAALGAGLEFWWRLGWAPILALPLAWYLVMLWYSGAWEARSSALWRRQRVPFVLTLFLLVVLIGLILANSLPSYLALAQADPQEALTGGATQVLLLLYPVYTLACIGLSIDALRHPAPSARLMGDRARRRARPWLVAASFVLLGVGLAVGGVLAWVIEIPPGSRSYTRMAVDPLLAAVDLLIEGGIAAAVLLIGQAVARYEIFTGQALPQRGLAQLWGRAVILAGGFSLVAGWSLAIQLRPVYGVLLSALILAAFFGLIGWRQYAERERWMQQLRPFVSSQRLYDQVLATAPPGSPSAPPPPFTALCRDVLGAGQAALVPLGPLAALVGDPLVYPPAEGSPASGGWVAACAEQAAAKGPARLNSAPFPLDPQLSGGYWWAAPLWKENGLAGLLALGEKRDGGLYTREEIAVAVSAGEQILDSLASAELARRLMRLQRRQLAESQVFDRQLRRALHDEVLPQVHQAILAVDRMGPSLTSEKQVALDTLSDLHHQISNLLRGLKAQGGLEVGRIGALAALHAVVEDELTGAFASVAWQVEPGAESLLAGLPPTTAEVLYFAAREALRNAACHTSASAGPLPALQIEILGERMLELRIENSGGESGPSTHGSGSGLSLHSTMMSIIGGALVLEATPLGATRVTLSLPGEALARMGPLQGE